MLSRGDLVTALNVCMHIYVYITNIRVHAHMLESISVIQCFSTSENKGVCTHEFMYVCMYVFSYL